MFQEEKMRRFGRVDIIAGERVGVANAPLPDTHRTATPTVSRFLAIFMSGFCRGQFRTCGVG